MAGQNRGLYIAGALFALVAAIYFFADKNVKAPTVSSSPLPAAVLDLGASQVQQVVVHARGKVVTVTREGTGWSYSICAEGQADCPTGPADPSRSLQLVQNLTGLRPSHVIYGAPEGLPAYGVEKPTGGEIDIKGRSGQQVILLVGGKSPDGSSYFVRRQDSQNILTVPVTTVDGELLGLVDKPPAPIPSPAASPPGAAPPPAASPSP
ncbi:MAG: hypothetical protein NVSMB17_11720 [Candidatus Dormibacteria bacterium]